MDTKQELVTKDNGQDDKALNKKEKKAQKTNKEMQKNKNYKGQ